MYLILIINIGLDHIAFHVLFLYRGIVLSRRISILIAISFERLSLIFAESVEAICDNWSLRVADWVAMKETHGVLV